MNEIPPTGYQLAAQVQPPAAVGALMTSSFPPQILSMGDSYVMNDIFDNIEYEFKSQSFIDVMFDKGINGRCKSGNDTVFTCRGTHACPPSRSAP